jgi:amino-acid N-acetyltransferase
MTLATVPLRPHSARAVSCPAGEPSQVELRVATPEDVEAIHSLVADHVASDHLLPRTREEIAARISRFVVGDADGAVVGCAEQVRGMGVGRLILDALVHRAVSAGHRRLCAFTHGPAYFIRLGFSIVPHLWVREKVFTDCVGCPLFRSCGQHAVVLALDDRQVRRTTLRLQGGVQEQVA